MKEIAKIIAANKTLDSPDEKPEQDAVPKLDFAKITNLLDWQIQCSGRHPLLHIRDDDKHTHKFLTTETNRWNNRDDDAYCPPASIETFVRQLVDCLANIESRDRITLMKRIQTLGGYGYSSGGVTGRNDYGKDVSRVDGRLIQRKR